MTRSVHDAALSRARWAIGTGQPMPLLLVAASRDHVLSVAAPDITELLTVAIATAPLVSARSLTSVTDSYHLIGPDDEGYDYGDLAARFEAGDPAVGEVLTACTAYRVGLPRFTLVPYRREAGGIDWAAAPLVDDHARQLSGRVADTLRTILMEPEPLDADQRATLDRLGETAVFELAARHVGSHFGLRVKVATVAEFTGGADGEVEL